MCFGLLITTKKSMLMKTLKIFLVTLIFSSIFTSCVIVDNDLVDNRVSLEEVVSNYDLWYVDFNSTQGNGEVPFVSRAFTLSFLNGRMYANNNIADVGFTGNGLGILVGDYYTDGGTLETQHDVDGFFEFSVEVLSANEIRIDDLNQNVSYYLVGYQTNDFDYDKLFYDNIEYFLQEYVAWERTALAEGAQNIFDEERFLQFTPENITTFYSSTDSFGTNVEQLEWDFVGNYTVYDVAGFDDLKGLTLNYEGGDIETFELSVLDNRTIQLYHQSSNTTYTFIGKGFIQVRRGDVGEANKSVNRNENRKRTIIKRETVDRSYLK